MRIALLSFELPPETGFGGIGTYTWTQARALAALGHEITVHAGAAAPGAEVESRIDSVTVRRLGDRRRRGPVARLLGSLGWWWSANRLENGRRMRVLVSAAERAGRFDVVEFPDCGAEALRLPRQGRSRRIARFHSPAECIMPFYATRAGDRRLCAALERRSLARANRFTACSKFLADEARARGLAREIATIPNGIDLAPGAPPASGRWRVRLGIGERPMLLFAGRIEPRKGAALLGEVVPDLLRRRDLAVVVAGEDLFGHAARELVPAAEGAAPGRLFLLGRRTPGEVGELLAESDVVWIPSRWESCPYAVLEAMASGASREGGGAAIVASAVGGIPELVRHEREALLAGDADAPAHRAALERLFDAPDERRRLALAARRRVETEFSAETVASRSLELYTEIARGAAG